MISGIFHLILGRIAIIDRMQANKGRTPSNIRIPRPSMIEDVKPITILDRLEVIVEDNCVITKSVKDTISMIVNVDTGTRLTWNSFWKTFFKREQCPLWTYLRYVLLNLFPLLAVRILIIFTIRNFR